MEKSAFGQVRATDMMFESRLTTSNPLILKQRLFTLCPLPCSQNHMVRHSTGNVSIFRPYSNCTLPFIKKGVELPGLWVVLTLFTLIQSTPDDSKAMEIIPERIQKLYTLFVVLPTIIA